VPGAAPLARGADGPRASRGANTMKKKMCLGGSLVACMATAWFGWGWLHARGDAETVASGPLRPATVADGRAGLPDDSNVASAPARVESTPALEDPPALGKKAERELLGKINAEANTLLDLQEILGEDLSAYRRLQEEIRTGDQPESIIAFVDLVTSVAEHYAPWENGAYMLPPGQQQKAKSLYTLAVNARAAFEQAPLWQRGDVLTSLLAARLEMLKYSLQLFGGGEEVPRFDRDEARQQYERLQRIEPDGPVTAYLKTALLYQGQIPFLASRTEIKGLYQLERQCPDTRYIHERILLHQIRTWAFFEEAETIPWKDKDLAKDKALRYQYAIDSYERVDPVSQRSMNVYNRRYLEQIVNRATENLLRARPEAEAQGVDVDWHLRQRRRWEYPWDPRH
jgi:hypothetical protein